MALKVVPTKGNLISTKKQLQLAVLGYDLLDKKRNVLIKEMMSLLDDVKMVRDEITEAYQNAYDALQEANISLGLISDLVTATPDFHVKFERIHPFQDGNGRVGRLLMFKECLKHNIVPFIIEDDLKMFYYRGLKEWNREKGYLMDTCLTAQDRYKAYLDYFRIPY